MRGTRLDPERITHPFQLMAAWFAMLIILVGILLAAAAKIENPAWIPGFLVASSIVLSVLVIAAVFLMLTRFRPHLQEGKEYAEWLKDERRFRGQALQTLEIKEIQTSPAALSPSREPDLSDFRLFRHIATQVIEVSNLEGVNEVIGSLRRLGFKADIYRERDESGSYSEDKSEHAAIWIGSRVPPHVAVLAIHTVIGIWPHLRYVHLSGDVEVEPPDYIHDEIYFGGATSTARRYGLKSWRAEEIARIPADIEVEEFHELIRSKYTYLLHEADARDELPATPARRRSRLRG